jgi:hypothetical protein
VTNPDPIVPCPWQEDFTLVLKASPSFQLDYGVKLACSEERCRLWTKNAPGIDAHHPSRPFGRGPGRLLPRADRDRILALLGKVRLSAAACGGLGCDGTTYHLKLVRGSLSMDLEWWEGLTPEGWDGLQPLIEALEEYASIHGVRPEAGPSPD